MEQPIFGANYIKGKVRNTPQLSNFVGEVKFKLHFKSGGAIDFGQAMLKAAQMASRLDLLIKIFSSMASKPINICWIRTGSQTHGNIMYSTVLHTIFPEYS